MAILEMCGMLGGGSRRRREHHPEWLTTMMMMQGSLELHCQQPGDVETVAEDMSLPPELARVRLSLLQSKDVGGL